MSFYIENVSKYGTQWTLTAFFHICATSRIWMTLQRFLYMFMFLFIQNCLEIPNITLVFKLSHKILADSIFSVFFVFLWSLQGLFLTHLPAPLPPRDPFLARLGDHSAHRSPGDAHTAQNNTDLEPQGYPNSHQKK